MAYMIEGSSIHVCWALFVLGQPEALSSEAFGGYFEGAVWQALTEV